MEISGEEERKMVRKGMQEKWGCAQNSTSQEEMNARIKEIAQDLYEKRGRVPGHEMDDWLKAEKIVKRECRKVC